MTVLLYGVTHTGDRMPDGHGLADRPLRALSHENLRAIVSDLDQPPTTQTQTLCAYERVVEGLMAGDGVLPARFGTTADSDDDVMAMLITRYSELASILERVSDAVEFAVHTGDPADKPTNGTEYMNRLLQRDRRIHTLDARVAEIIRGKRRRGTSTAYLVEASGADEFLQETRILSLTVTGPWPAYSFVSAPES